MSNSENQVKKDYFWNMMGSGMAAAFSVLIIWIVTRITGEYTGGVFAFAYTVAQQLQTVGQYEVRNFQSTDIKEQFSFDTYLSFRIITCGIMLFGAAIYGVAHEGLTVSAFIIFLACVLKFFDAFEDVFHGMFQQHRHLYIAGKALFYRLLFTLGSFIVTLIITKNLVVSCIISIIISTIALIALNFPQAKKFVSIRPAFYWSKIKALCITCLPLFLGSFILLFIYNLPRYRMEAFLPKNYQTYYTILFMPASVINLFSGFAFKPMLTTLAVSWNEKREGQFFKMLFGGLGMVLIFTLVVTLCGYFLGIPVLSWFYGVQLTEYKTALLFFLIGGGFSAANIILYYGLTVMRKQKLVLLGYILTVLCAIPVSGPMIQQWGMTGAAVLYMGLMLLLCLIFGTMIAISTVVMKRKDS